MFETTVCMGHWPTAARRLAGCLMTAATLVIATHALAQDGDQVPIPMNTPATVTGQIVAGLTRLELPFTISGANKLALDVIIPVDGANLQLLSPSGAVVASSGSAGVEFYPGSELPIPAPGGVFEVLDLPTPVDGIWRLVLSFPPAPSPTVAIATVRAVSRIQAGIAIERTSLLVGEDVGIGMLLTDNGAPIHGLAPTIAVSQVGGSAGAPVTALDDGAGADGLASDGVYSIDHTFTQAGTYDIVGQATISGATGPVQRTAMARVKVTEPLLTNPNVTLNNTLGSGNCVSGLRVQASFTVARESTYASLIRLTGGNGQSLEVRGLLTDDNGTASTTAVFSARELKEKIGVDGPYVVSLINVLDIDGNDLTLAFRSTEAGAFNVPLSSLCALPIEFPGPLTVTPVLKNGYIGSLNINIPIKVTVSGNYQISYKVFGANGEDLGLVNASRSLAVGTNNVATTLTADDFLSADGPFRVVSLLVVGGGSSERLSVVGQSTPLSRWQFYPRINGDLNADGSVDSADNAIVTQYRNQTALKPGDRRDLDRNGVINLLDARLLQRLACKAPSCPTNP